MMKKVTTIVTSVLATLALVGLMSTAYALYTPPGPNANARYTLTVGGAAFSGLAINAAKEFEAINVGGYHTVLVEVQYTYSAASAITMTCTESPDNSNWFQIPQVDESSPPTVAFAQRTWSWTLASADVDFYFEVPVRYRYLKCSMVGTGADASDVVTASATVAE